MGTVGTLKRAPALVIAAGQQNSNVLPANVLEDLVAVMLYGPATLDALTFALQVNPDPLATNASSGWVALCDSAGNGLTAPAALKAQLYNEIPHAGALRVRASSATTNPATWAVSGVTTT